MLTPAVATITLARDSREEALILDGLTALSRTHLEVVAADGGSPPRFVDAVRGLPGITVVRPERSALVGQIEAAVGAAAARAPWIVYTEPDKAAFFDSALVRFLESAVAMSDAAVVLASRSDRAFASFPPMQQLTESAFNRICRALIALDADCLYGPFLFQSRLASELAAVDEALGWGWRPFLFARAFRRRMRIAAVAGDYWCPDDQRSEDDGDRMHRLRQLQQNVAGLLNGLTSSSLG